jgi:acetyl esterase/lipase
VTEHILNDSKALNLDTNTYILAGDSSGGHAAAYITQFLTINGKTPPTLQLLIYPWVQM